MSEISNPHDRFFKEVLSHHEASRDFLLYYLPPEIAGMLDTTTLELTKDSFVDKDLREHFSDLLYKVDLKRGESAYVYVLFEHKSYPEPLIGLHLLRYMVRIWEQSFKQIEGKLLRPIIPVVVYHGQAKWRSGIEFNALFDAESTEGLRKYLPDFRYILYDLSQYSDDDIKGTVTLKVMLLLMKHIFSEDLWERLPEIFKLLRDILDKRSGIEYLETLLRYITSGTDKIRHEDLEKVVTEVLEDRGGNIMPTIAEELMEKGIQQGIQQGVQQGLIQNAREAVIESLETRFEVVPQSILKRIDDIDNLSLLKMLHKRSILAVSLEQFKEDLAKLME